MREIRDTFYQELEQGVSQRGDQSYSSENENPDMDELTTIVRPQPHTSGKTKVCPAKGRFLHPLCQKDRSHRIIIKRKPN